MNLHVSSTTHDNCIPTYVLKISSTGRLNYLQNFEQIVKTDPHVTIWCR